MSERKVINLYEYFKNTPKKLKIVCDWDEVIQTCEPYALWKVPLDEKYSENQRAVGKIEFSNFFEIFWDISSSMTKIDYSPYGSKLVMGEKYKNELEKQQEIKNSPNFYQEAPFLTIAEDLLRLIKEGKVDKLIFLSAYDKRKFPDGDPRKRKIFEDTFGNKNVNSNSNFVKICSLQLIDFDSELLE